MTKGKITISRIHDGRGRDFDHMQITIEDDNYKLITKVNMDLREFACALTGLACAECEIEI